jgi:serine protease AprX
MRDLTLRSGVVGRAAKVQGTRASSHNRIKAAAVGLLTLAAGLVPLAGTASAATEAVIVQGPSAAAAAAAVERVGGHVDAALGLVGGVAARVDDADAATLRADGLAVTPDIELHATAKAKVPARPAAQPQVTVLDPDAGYPADAGKDVGVAVVDTGVTEVAGLAGKVVYAPDFSGEGKPRVDGYGHGTFMAGLVVGDGIGLAPGAKVVSVKVGDSSGTTTLSKLVAGLGWVAEHADTNNIRVLNLSFGVQTPFPYQANPLDSAVEALWASGITVVTAAGNEGAGVVTSPGDDPFVLTVGATGASWSGSQSFKGYSKPEVSAPGTSVLSYRAPGSQIDVTQTDGIVDATYRRGSGTSMATALVSGAAAVLAQHHPGATPDDIKGALTSTASNGVVDLNAADNATWSASWWQTYPLAFGGSDLGIPGWTAGMPWTAGHWAADYWTAGHWAAGQWAAGQWAAGHWADDSWVAGQWAAGQWAAGHWANGAWDAGHWAAGQWAAGQWAAGHWAVNAWASGHWAAGQWAAGQWAAGQWAAGQWAAGQWAAGQWAAGQWAAGQWAAGQWAAGQWADHAWT